MPVLPSYRNCRFVTGFCVRETLALNGLSKFSSLSLIHVDKFCEIQRYINFSKQNEWKIVFNGKKVVLINLSLAKINLVDMI